MAPPPRELMEELLEEILVRFPPDDPTSLIRAALVCKPWCRLVSGTAFRCRFRQFHLNRGVAPPLLGVLLYTSTTGDCCHKQQQQVRGDDSTSRTDDDDINGRCIKRARILPEPAPCFVPTTSFRPGLPAHAANSRLRYGWRAIDARHGRVLLRRSDPSLSYGRGLSVWDPITDELRDLPEPKFEEMMLGSNCWTAAVVCAATASGNCDHLDCNRRPFLVVMVDVQSHAIYRSIYSSESGVWSDLDILEHPDPFLSLRMFKQTPSVLVGNALYFLVHFNDEIVEYDLTTHDVSVISMPSEFHGLLQQRGVVLMTDDDGWLGFVANTTTTDHIQLELWSMVNGGFVQTRVIDLQKVLPSGLGAAPVLINNSLQVNGFGFADGGATANSRFLFMRTSDGLYSIEINCSHVRKVANCCGDDDVVPYINFCTPNAFQGRPGTVGMVADERPS